MIARKYFFVNLREDVVHGVGPVFRRPEREVEDVKAVAQKLAAEKKVDEEDVRNHIHLKRKNFDTDPKGRFLTNIQDMKI
jgi:hypothetical protein